MCNDVKQQPSAPTMSRYKQARLKDVKVWDKQDVVLSDMLWWYSVSETRRIIRDVRNR